MPSPTLTGASVTFQTTDDDKRKESILDLRVVDKNNDIIARASDAYGLFDNNTTNGPFNLEVLQQSEIKNLKPGRNFVLTWTPWAAAAPLTNHDEWHFNLFVELLFSDGQHVVVDENTLILSYNQNMLNFGL